MIRVWAVFLVIGVMLAAACTRSPDVQKARYLERGDRYTAREQYREAIIEYRNALRYDQANARAIRHLGLAHYNVGELEQAYRYLLKARELAPGDPDVRVKLGAIYLLAGKREDARGEATFVLGKEPKNLDALTLLGDTSTTPADVGAAIQRLEEARSELGDRAKLHLTLGILYLRNQDLPNAERAFREAVAREPKSAQAHLGLGNFYLSRRDTARAELELKTAGDLAPVGSPAQMALANFYILERKPDEARRVLTEMTRQAPDNLPAWRQLAEIALHEGKYDESLRALQVVLKKNAADLEAHFLLGRVRSAKGQITEATQEFQQVLKLEPRYAPARYHLALVQLQTGNVQQAKAELKEATSSAPNFVEAVLLLAELNIQAGAVQPAIEDLESFVARRPNSVQAYRLLGSAYLAKRDPVRATEVFRKLVTLAPKDPRGIYLVGIGLLAHGKTADAKHEFETALALAPQYVDPLAQLVAIAFRQGQPDMAVSLVTKQVARAPTSGGLQHLLGLAYLERRDPQRAEAAFMRAIELEPQLVDAYLRLGALYATSARYDEALAKLNEALKVNPRNLRGQMLVGLIYEGRGDLAKAHQAYETALTLNSRFAPAANNLAWLLSEHGGDKEKALELAQAAKQAAPDDPHVSDTLGWILYKRGVYQRAVGLLKESTTKLPDNPVIQYHFGLASVKVGDKDGARKALTLALKSPVSFAGKDDARRALAELE